MSDDQATPQKSDKPQLTPEYLFGTIKKVAGFLRPIQQRLDKLEFKIADLEEKLEQAASAPSGTPRKVSAPNKNIIAAIYMMRELSMPIREVAETGVMTKSRVQGVSSWPESYADTFIKQHDEPQGGVFELGEDHPEWNDIAPNFQSIMEQKETEQ